MAGKFFSFDGIDGVGKTTQLELFCEWLRKQGREVIRCRDPGGTNLGEALREIILHREETPLGPLAEMLLYMASRAQLVAEVIGPALAAGKTVVSDRFLLSNVAYQGHAGGIDVETVWQVGDIATHRVMPDMTFLLDLPVALAKSRLGEQLDRMEARGSEFQTRVREGFLAEAQRAPDQIAIIDASRTPSEVQADIRAVATRILDGEL